MVFHLIFQMPLNGPIVKTRLRFVNEYLPTARP